MASTQPVSGSGALRVTVQETLLGRARFGVRARLDGEPVQVRHGDTVIPVSAGRHEVECFMIFAAEYGNASAEVDVPCGGEARVHYAPPFHRFIEGRMGLTPQQPAGAWWVYLVLAVLVVGVACTLIF